MGAARDAEDHFTWSLVAVGAVGGVGEASSLCSCGNNDHQVNQMPSHENMDVMDVLEQCHKRAGPANRYAAIRGYRTRAGISNAQS